jgi:hypothetical protein
MQLGAAALFVANVAYSVISSLVFINHDSMVKVLNASSTTIPQGMTIDAMANAALAIAIATLVFIGILYLVAAVGSFLGWRWMFWAALVLFGLGAIGTLTNLSYFAKPSTSPVPIGAVAISELLSIASLAMFIWMLVGVIKFGPWAMKRPGS